MAFQFSITYGMHRMQYMYVGLNLYSVDMALNLNVLYSMNLNRNINESLAAYFGIMQVFILIIIFIILAGPLKRI